VRDQELLKAARHWAEQIIEADFALESEQYSRLHDTYFPMYHNREKLFNL
jgi:hypothetical protein